MTFFHFGNCVALAYVPYFIVYKCSGLADYGALWKCVQAGGAYLVTQLCKMMCLATFFPAFDQPSGSVYIFWELLKSTVDIADLIGLHLTMTQITGKGQMKFMVAGLGWATAELLMTKLFPLLYGARGTEFDWQYIQTSFDANISLLHHITTAALIWLFSRHDLNNSLKPIVMLLLAVSCYRPLIFQILLQLFGLGAWTLLMFRFIGACVVGLIALQLYLGITREVNSY